MAISDDLNSIRTHLEDDYKALETLGVSVEDRNIENIKDMAEQIYDKFPKTSYGEGTSVTLTGCTKGKLDFDKGEGQTYQYSTKGINFLPSVTTQTLNGITLTNNGDGTYYVEGTASALTYFDFFAGTFDSTTYENYYLKEYNYSNISSLFGTSSSAPLSYRISASNRTVIQQIGSTTTTGYIQIENNGTDLYLSLRIHNGAVLPKTLLKPMLVANSSQLSEEVEAYTGGLPAPSPSYPFPIKSVTGEQEVVVRGINKLSSANAETKTNNDFSVTCNGNGEYVVNSIPTGQYREIVFTLKSNYTITNGDYLQINNDFRDYRANIILKDTNNTAITSSITYNSDNKIVDLSSYANQTIKYISIGFSNTAEVKGSIKPLICNSSTQVPFEPYITPITKTLSLGNEEYHEINNYRDEIFKDLNTGNWYKRKKTGKYVGSDGITSNGATQDNFVPILLPVFDITANLNKSELSAITLCNLMSTAYDGENTDYSGFNGSTSVSRIRVNLSTRYASDLNTAKTFLANNNFTVIYKLNTPIDTQITDTTLINQLEDIWSMMSITGTTIVETEGDLPLIIKVRALKGGE